jgi:hypothetical protein
MEKEKLERAIMKEEINRQTGAQKPLNGNDEGK